MLQDIREKSKGWIQYLIIGFIAVTFLIIGTGSFSLNQNKQVVAKVNSMEITQREVDNYAERLMMSQSQAGQLDPSIFKVIALEQLVQDYAMKVATNKRGFVISKDQVISAINGDEAFRVNGTFSPDKYRNLLAQSYFTDSEFRSFIASALMNRQLEYGLVGTSFTLEDEVNTTFKYLDQKRDIEYVVLRHEDFLKDVKVSDEEVESFYQQNQQDFMSPELVKIAYVELSEQQLKSEIKVDDEILQAFYLENIALFTEPAKYKLAHILVSFNQGDKESQAQAAAKMEEIKSKLANGEDFAELAKQYSDDTVSGKAGGELPWLVVGSPSNDPAIEAAVMKMQKPGDRAEMVESSFGYHMIELKDKEEAVVDSFSKSKVKAKDIYLNNKAQEMLYDKADEMVSLAYEFSDSLDQVAENLNLEIKQSELFDRNGGDGDILSHKQVVRAAFSDEALVDKLNSELIEVGNNHFVVLRTIEHKPSEVIAFTEVKDKIRKILSKQAASKLTQAKAQAIAGQINDQGFKEAKGEIKYTWKRFSGLSRGDAALDYRITSKTFEIPRTMLNQADTVSLLDGDYAVLVLTKVTDGSKEGVSADLVAQYEASKSQMLGEMEYRLFAQEAKAQVKIEKADEE